MDCRDAEQAMEAGNKLPIRWVDRTPGEQLHALRSERRISQRALAALAGVEAAVICRLEAGRDARLSTWRKVYAALGFFATLVPVPSCEEADDLCIEEMERREERMRDQLQVGR